MTPAARVQAAIELLDLILISVRDNGPAADVIVNQWFRARRFAGSKDRRAISDMVYRAIRAHGDPPASGREAILALEDLHPFFDGSHYGPTAIGPNEAKLVPAMLPAWLSSRIDTDEQAALLERAPLDVRANSLKTSREALMEALPHAEIISHTKNGLRLNEREKLPAELAGLADVQDAGSQIIAEACQARPGDLVIDLCAGAGGKTLALAGNMENRGRLIACDTDRGRLSRLIPRAEVSGVTCVETRLMNHGQELAALDDIIGHADVVLVDAPCSGSGTWRRNPELRWRLNENRLLNVVKLQAQILKIAFKLVRPGGRLIYAVCSILPEEGERQIGAFLSAHPEFAADKVSNLGRPAGEGRLLTPAHDGCDGFFFATLSKAC